MKNQLRNIPYLLLICLAPVLHAQPVITEGAVTNGASFVSSELPGGALAQGSIITIKGENLGPGTAANAATGVSGSIPYATTLGGTSVTVTDGTRTVNAFVMFAWTSQVNAILPSNAPTGNVNVRVSYNGQTSGPVRARVVPTNFGIFSVAGGQGPGIVQNFIAEGNTPVNNATTTARPGQPVVLWGTGLGPVTVADNIAPQAAQPTGITLDNVIVTVGGRTATVMRYAGRSFQFPGLDQIVFDVPADAPEGCFVPVQVRIGSTFSNFVSMAINRSNATCSDPLNPLSGLVKTGGRFGAVVLARLQANLAGLGSQTFDLGNASFDEVPALGDFSFNQFASLPPIGTCTVLTSDESATGLVDGGTDLYTGRPLDAGPRITVTGALGTRQIEKDSLAEGYFSFIGGGFPLPGQPAPQPLFLEGGTYTVSGPGGTDVGPFSATVNLPAPLTWTNQPASVNRSSNLVLTWTGGGANQTVVIAGASNSPEVSSSAIFICFAPASAGTFTVPASILSNLPPSGSSLEDGGVLGLAALPSGQVPTFTATGLTSGSIVSVSAVAGLVTYQ